MDSTSSAVSRPSTNLQQAEKTRDSRTETHWQVLLSELVHLLGVFLYHSGNFKESCRTDALFDQIIRHLRIILKMPAHEGGLLIRRTSSESDTSPGSAGYQVLYGEVLIQERPVATDDASQPSTASESALGKAFEHLAEMGIQALYLQLAELSAEKIEQLRLCMHLIARFNYAADADSSITFRYKDRDLNLPVIYTGRGKPDPNLTLVAALNGLSAANTRELIKQAAAIETLQTAIDLDHQTSESVSVEYNQIFNVRSFKSQIIKPLVEINNIPWVQPNTPKAVNSQSSVRPEVPAPHLVSAQTVRPALEREAVAAYLDPSDAGAMNSLDALFMRDLNRLSPLQLAERFEKVTQLLYAIDQSCQDPRVIDSILDHLRHQLIEVPDQVLAAVVAKRQGLKINTPGRSVLIGMVHPRLFDLIILVKERIDVRLRTDIIKEIAFDFDETHADVLADGFQLTSKEALHILDILKNCFGTNGAFIRPAFEKQVDLLSQCDNAIFEILWCFLKITPARKDRLGFLNAIQLVMANMQDTKRALQFLMADVSQVPTSVSYTDRNAFALANILLHKENKELYVDISRTPEAVLSNQRSVDQRLRHYAAWRLEVDQVQFLEKTRTIHYFLETALDAQTKGNPELLEMRFLLALAREVLIFCAIVGGHTARVVLREAIDRFGEATSSIYQKKLNTHTLSNLITHLQIAVRALGRAGLSSDMERLRALEKDAKALSNLDAHPAHKLRVNQVMKWVPKALRTIQIQG